MRFNGKRVLPAVAICYRMYIIFSWLTAYNICKSPVDRILLYAFAGRPHTLYDSQNIYSINDIKYNWPCNSNFILITFFTKLDLDTWEHFVGRPRYQCLIILYKWQSFNNNYFKII